MNNIKKVVCFVLIFLALNSCKKEKFVEKDISQQELALPIKEDKVAINECSTVVNLFAAGNTIVGKVTVSNDQNYITVHYNTKTNWKITRTNLFVGGDTLFTKTYIGNEWKSEIESFPFKSVHENDNECLYNIPISDSSLECVLVAAYAEVHNLNSGKKVYAWGDGYYFPDNTELMYSKFCIKNCNEGIFQKCDPSDVLGGDFSSLKTDGEMMFSQIKRDSDFKKAISNLVLIQDAEIDVIERFTQLSPNEITEDELTKYSKALGFNNYSEYLDYYNSSRATIKTLVKKYDFSSTSPNELKSLIYNSNIRINKGGDRCEDNKNSDGAWATGLALAGNIACGFADAAFGAGILCHAAVVANYANEMRKINRDYQDCIANR